ncbi:PAS domain S-box protein [Gloeocapsopsis dulcis]|nr:PAS domain S-box protein [Gloeocapsopsis dulcis]WNN88414.1 PAS domain S-box protein [Gloeocapsopsis dulcis]
MTPETGQTSLDDILITPELSRRAPRTSDLKAENDAFRTLARQLVEQPQTMLQTLAAIAKDLCQAGTAGVSLLEVTPSGEEFRLVALAGELAGSEQGTVPRQFSFCGVCLECRAAQLYSYPARYFTHLQLIKPAIVESLVIPLVAADQPLGAIWIVSHDPQRQFDGEDARVMTSLADFTAAALYNNQTRQAAESAQSLLHMLLEHVPEGITIAGEPPDFPIVATSRVAQELLGKPSKTILGLSSGNYIQSYGLFLADGATRPTLEQIPLYRATRYGETVSNEEWVIERFDGSRITALVQAVPLRDAQRQIIGAINCWRDITERKQAEKALRESETRFRLMVESAKEYAIFTLDLNGMITSWNSGAERLLGYQEAEILGRDGRIIFTPEDNARGKADQEKQIALAQGQAENERWHVRKDGSRFWGSGLVMPLQTEVGTTQGFIKIMQDRTKHRQADERLRLLYDTTSDLLATEQPLALMHNLFSKLAAQLELDDYYQYMVEEKDNQQMLHLSSYAGISEEVAQAIAWIEFGQYLCGLVAQARRQIVLNQAQIATHPNAQSICSLGITAYAGQPLIVQGRLLGTLSFASRTRTNFTPEEIDLLQSTCDQMAIALERANLNASLQQQAEQLIQVNRIKDEFLAVLSHELRSPLNPILGWTKLLQSGKLDAAKTAQALATIERNAKLQTELIEDLLDVSRILQGKLSLNIRQVNLAMTVEAALETVSLAAQAKAIEIQTTFDAQVGVLGDSSRLQQIVWNLVSNAVKFTPPGGRVAVRLTRVGNQAQITVTDTGKGIDPEFLPYVFEYFRQEDGATTRQFGGLGLGLAIVRHLVELHGGSVAADSLGEGQGATFTVKLPISDKKGQENPEQRLTSPSTTDRPLLGMRVLVVDDEPDMRDVIAFSLEQSGAEVMTVASAAAALVALAQFQPDILLSDIGMPGMDGYMLLRQVRTLSPEEGGQVPAIALTAYAAEVEQQQALQAGFQRHLAKPVEPDILVKEIVKLLSNRQRT